jgi:hypothetical protein
MEERMQINSTAPGDGKFVTYLHRLRSLAGLSFMNDRDGKLGMNGVGKEPAIARLYPVCLSRAHAMIAAGMFDDTGCTDAVSRAALAVDQQIADSGGDIDSLGHYRRLSMRERALDSLKFLYLPRKSADGTSLRPSITITNYSGHVVSDFEITCIGKTMSDQSLGKNIATLRHTLSPGESLNENALEMGRSDPRAPLATCAITNVSVRD